MNPPAPTLPKSRLRHWLRVLRPLVWWLLLVLALYGHRLHQRRLLDTRLRATPRLGNRDVRFEARLELDGQPFQDGNRVPLGWHKLTIQHPKAESFTTNLFIWYGPHDLGPLDLKRTTGTLALTAEPPASVLRVQGPEFSATYTNSPGITVTVPTDRYTVEARCPHWQGREELVVEAGRPASHRFAPQLGSVRLTSNQAPARYQLEAASGGEQASGELPAIITGLPVGEYRVVAEYDGDRREAKVQVTDGQTNDTAFTFVYGVVELETQPAGARVTVGPGRDLGVTPLQLARLAAGSWEFKLTKDGYLPVTLHLDVLANQTNAVSTNLVNAGFAEAMAAARQAWAAGDAGRTLDAVGVALKIQPNDAEALRLQQDATIAQALQAGRAAFQSGNHALAREALGKVLRLAPEHPEASRLLKEMDEAEAERQRRIQAAADRERRERTALLQQALDDTLRQFRPAEGFFQRHELHTAMPAAQAAQAIYNALTGVAPTFAAILTRGKQPDGPFVITSFQSVGLGERRCIVGGVSLKAGETLIMYKVIEYKGTLASQFSGRGHTEPLVADQDASGAPSAKSRLPRGDRQQLEQGLPMVTARLKRALGINP